MKTADLEKKLDLDFVEDIFPIKEKMKEKGLMDAETVDYVVNFAKSYRENPRALGDFMFAGIEPSVRIRGNKNSVKKVADILDQDCVHKFAKKYEANKLFFYLATDIALIATCTEDPISVKKAVKLVNKFFKKYDPDNATIKYVSNNIHYVSELGDARATRAAIDMASRFLPYSEALDHFLGDLGELGRSCLKARGNDVEKIREYLEAGNSGEEIRKICRGLNHKTIVDAIAKYSDEKQPSKFGVKMYNHIACTLSALAFKTKDSKLVRKTAEVVLKCKPKVADKALSEIYCAARLYPREVKAADEIATKYLQKS